MWRHRDLYTSNEIDGMITKEGKPFHLISCLPQILRVTVWYRTRSFTLRSRWLTARDKARPVLLLSYSLSEHYTGTSALSTTNPTWNCLGLNSVLHVEKPEINSLRQSKASLAVKLPPFRPLYRVLVGRPQGRRTRGRHRRRWAYENRSLRGGWGGMDWIDLAQYTDRWRALVNAAKASALQKMRANSWLAEKLLVYQEGLSSR